MSHKDDYDKDKYIKELEGLIKYQYAYDIFMEYWDSLPDEIKPKMHKQDQKILKKW